MRTISHNCRHPALQTTPRITSSQMIQVGPRGNKLSETQLKAGCHPESRGNDDDFFFGLSCIVADNEFCSKVRSAWYL